MGLPAKQVEQLAVGYLNAILPRIFGVEADLVIHNNGALTDGSISIYKSNKQKIEDFDRSFSVQVKGSTNSKIFSGERPTFRKISRVSIEKYQQLGGLLLFVVIINPKNAEVTQVLYRTLSPFRIAQLLEKTEGMKFPPIELSYFPQSQADQRSVLQQVAYDLSHDHSENPIRKTELKPEKIKIPIYQTSTSISAGPDALENRDFLAYGQAKGVEWVLGEIRPENMTMFVRLEKSRILFPNQQKFPAVNTEVKKYHQPTLTEIRTGKEQMIRMAFSPKNEDQKETAQVFSGSFNLHVAATLEHEIENTSAYLSFLKSPILVVNENVVDLSSFIPKDRQEQIDHLSNRLRILELKQKAGKNLGVDFYDVRGLSDSDVQTLESLFSLFCHRDTNKRRERLMLSIGPFDHAIIVADDFVSTLFDKRVEKKLQMLVGSDQDSTDLVVVNPYTMISSNIHLSKIPDFSPTLILNWYRNHPNELKSERQSIQAEYYCLNLIVEFKDTSDERMLTLADQIQPLLKKSGSVSREYVFFISQYIGMLKGSKRSSRDLEQLVQYSQSTGVGARVLSKAILGDNRQDLQNEIDLFPSDDVHDLLRSITEVMWRNTR